MIRVHLAGGYGHRQPLAYAPIRAACAGALRRVDRLEAAEVVLIAHVRDLETHGTELRRRLGAGQRLVLLSEEPLWDTVWGGGAGRDPLRRRQIAWTEAGPLPYLWLNHATSPIFDFEAIPYFLLTDHHFATRYRRWFARNARLTPGDWRNIWAAARWSVVFMARRRHGEAYDRDFGQGQLRGLSGLRSRIAEACTGPRVLRTGTGWGDPARQDLPDWHLDKFLRLSGQARLISSLENTYHPLYVTEKLFDTYAAGAIPLYAAGMGHRAREIARDGAWLELGDLEAGAAAARIMAFAPDAAFAEGYAATQRRLAALFADPAILEAELARLRGALVAELAAALQQPA